MNWRPQTDPYYVRSMCGNYTVCMIGGDRGPRFESWFHKEQLAVGFQTQASAQQHCDTHAAEQARAA